MRAGRTCARRGTLSTVGAACQRRNVRASGTPASVGKRPAALTLGNAPSGDATMCMSDRSRANRRGPHLYQSRLNLARKSGLPNTARSETHAGSNPRDTTQSFGHHPRQYQPRLPVCPPRNARFCRSSASTFMAAAPVGNSSNSGVEAPSQYTRNGAARAWNRTSARRTRLTNHAAAVKRR